MNVKGKFFIIVFPLLAVFLMASVVFAWCPPPNTQPMAHPWSDSDSPAPSSGNNLIKPFPTSIIVIPLDHYPFIRIIIFVKEGGKKSPDISPTPTPAGQAPKFKGTIIKR